MAGVTKRVRCDYPVPNCGLKNVRGLFNGAYLTSDMIPGLYRSLDPFLLLMTVSNTLERFNNLNSSTTIAQQKLTALNFCQFI